MIIDLLTQCCKRAATIMMGIDQLTVDMTSELGLCFSGYNGTRLNKIKIMNKIYKKICIYK